EVNGAGGVRRHPAVRWLVGGRAVTAHAASTSQMGRFETGAMTQEQNLTALADLSGRWIDRVQARRARTALVLDIDSSVSPTYGAQEGTAYNGHFACTCYHPLFVFNQDGDLERCALRAGNVHSAHGWHDIPDPVGAAASCAVCGPRRAGAGRPAAPGGAFGLSPPRFVKTPWGRGFPGPLSPPPPIGCSGRRSRRSSGAPGGPRRTPSGASMRASAI